MCYRNGYGCSYCGREENNSRKTKQEPFKGMTRQDFLEAVKVLGAICDTF